MTIKKLILVLLVIGLPLTAKAQADNLQPETGYFSGFYPDDSYYPVVKKVLFDSLSYYTDLRVVVLPSFLPEYLISLDTKDGNTYLTYRIANRQIYNFPGPSSDKVQFSTYKIQFDSSIAKKIHQLYFMAISKAKFIPRDSGLDGTSYFFMVFHQSYGLICGKTWTPTTGKMGDLVTITDWLKYCAKSGSLQNRDKMQVMIDGLIEKFN
jgi:hypothetical protein